MDPTPPPAPDGPWRRLAEPEREPLLRAAAEADPASVTDVARLRKLEPDAETVRGALALAEARRKAALKFGPDLAARLWADTDGVEMATSLAVAACKASRFAHALPRGAEVLDLCCGAGGDAIGLAREGFGVTAVDADPARAWMAGRNLAAALAAGSGRGAGSVRVQAVCRDAVEAALSHPCDAAHLDPARRVETGDASGLSPRRVWRLEDTCPGPDAVAKILHKVVHAAVKLSPAIDGSTIPDAWRTGAGELEYISERGRLTQAVWWTGRLAPPRRRATLVAGGRCHSVLGTPGLEIPVAPVADYLLEPDPSIERAGLLGQECAARGAAMLHPLAGVMTADAPIDDAMYASFRVLDEMAWNPRRVKARLRDLGAGIVEVKTRAKAVDPDAVQSEMRGEGETTLTLFVLRLGNEVRAIITERA